MVCTFGLSDRTRRFMDGVFKEHLDGAYILAEEVGADVAIIDIDANGGRVEFQRQQKQYPERMIVLLTADEASARTLNGIVIVKPVHLDHFVKIMKSMTEWISRGGGGGASRPAAGNALSARGAATTTAATRPAPRNRDASKEVGRAGPTAGPFAPETERVLATLQPRVRHYYLGTQADVSLDVPEERAKVYYDPAEFLQGFVQRAIRTGVETASVMTLSSSRFGSIEIHPFARLARVSATSAALYAAARAPLREGDVHIEPAPDLPQMPVDREGLEPLDALLWQLALWASRGHVPVGADLDQPVVVKHWPNLTRLLFPPHATQIVALWARRATPLAVSASTLGIPQRYVFASYSACAALDLILVDRRAMPRPTVPRAPTPMEKHTLFGMLRAKLAQGRND